MHAWRFFAVAVLTSLAGMGALASLFVLYSNVATWEYLLYTTLAISISMSLTSITNIYVKDDDTYSKLFQAVIAIYNGCLLGAGYFVCCAVLRSNFNFLYGVWITLIYTTIFLYIIIYLKNLYLKKVPSTNLLIITSTVMAIFSGFFIIRYIIFGAIIDVIRQTSGDGWVLTILGLLIFTVMLLTATVNALVLASGRNLSFPQFD